MILNIQEIHDLVFWGAGGVGFSGSSAHTQTYIGQVCGHRREQTQDSRVFYPMVMFQVKESFLTWLLLTCSGKFHVKNSLPPPSSSSQSDHQPVGIPCCLPGITLSGNMEFIHLFTHSPTTAQWWEFKDKWGVALPSQLLGRALGISERPVNLLFVRNKCLDITIYYLLSYQPQWQFKN